MSSVVIGSSIESPAEPRRRGRPRSAASVAVRKHADAILRSDVSVARIAQEYGVHPVTVYRWLKSAETPA